MWGDAGAGDAGVGDLQRVEVLDLEPGVFDRGAGVAVGVAAADEEGPDGGVEGSLDPGEAGGRGADVLEEPELAAGSEDPAHLDERGGDVGDAAEHERGDHGVVGRVVGGQVVGGPVDDLDRHGRVSGLVLGEST